MDTSTKYKRLIIDGNNLIYPAYHINRPPVFVNGINTVPIHQFLNMLKSIVNKFQPTDIVLTWDKRLISDSTNFRKSLVPYKEQRPNTEDHTLIHECIEQLQPITDSLGIQTMYPSTFEADDVICFLTKFDDGPNIVISSDKDLLQLVSNTTHVYLPSKKITVTPDNFEEIVGVKAKIFVLYKCILGDVSDNIPGLEKYGPIKSKRLAESIDADQMTTYNIINYPTSEFDEQKFNLTDEQVQILQRNIALMDLNYMHPELIVERNSYKSQMENKNVCFDADKFRSACYMYNMFTFIREIGIWRKLFDKNNTDHNKDLLSMISM